MLKSIGEVLYRVPRHFRFLRAAVLRKAVLRTCVQLRLVTGWIFRVKRTPLTADFHPLYFLFAKLCPGCRVFTERIVLATIRSTASVKVGKKTEVNICIIHDFIITLGHKFLLYSRVKCKLYSSTVTQFRTSNV
jgi:hypothetical protein